MGIDRETIRRHIEASARTISGLGAQADTIGAIAGAIGDTLASGGRVLTCGNGGSAAEAMHLSEELVGRYKADRPPLAGLCLNADATAITCIANDFGYDQVFARQVRGLGTKGDVLVVFSTSGKSANIVLALEAARDMGVTTIGLLGKGGGPCAPLCDHALVVDSDQTERIQEAHQVVLHLILESVESGSAAAP